MYMLNVILHAYMIQKVIWYGIISGGFPYKRPVTSGLTVDNPVSFLLEYNVNVGRMDLACRCKYNM